MEWSDANMKMCLRVSFVFMTTLLGIVGINDIVVHYHTPHASPLKVCNQSKPLTNIHTTKCSYLKQILLKHGKPLTLCPYHKTLRIDIRQSNNEKATIQEIWLCSKEWTNLFNSTSRDHDSFN